MIHPARAPAHEVTGPWPIPLSFLWPAGLCALVLAWFVFSYGYLEDDAFIHLEFARNVAEGRGFAFGALVTNGDTSPLWVLVLVVIHAVGLGWIESAKFACMLGLLVTVLAILRLTHDLVAAGPRQRWFGVAGVAVTVLNPYFVHWSFSGMESVTALGLSLWAIWAIFVGRPTGVRLTVGAALLGAAPLLRPELLLLDAIAGPVVLWHSWQTLSREPPAVRVARSVVLATIMVLPLAVWSAYALRESAR